MTKEDAEDLMRQQTFEFLVRFSDGVLETAANRLCTETAYNLLRDLTYEEYVAVVRKVLTMNMGTMQ